MQITKVQVDGTTIVSVEGEVNLNSSPQLKKVFDELIKQNTDKVIVDFTTISYIDSSGLATLIEMFQRIKQRNGFMALSGISPKIKSIFEVTKLDKLFAIYNSREDALASRK